MIGWIDGLRGMKGHLAFAICYIRHGFALTLMVRER